ncbi:sigma-54-dependent transcriptional regulator [Vibrio genomosp. F10]|uniref:sigma-54-dependent transcriptional regulator n=1 Tax=Vibrio genomosp. F10 TaxID=723171 RepID=UPI0003078F37|nr:sigma-54 dependent transcriptional regulator [Vibrio genomosp. F10]OEF09218.1 C4-dicarboxylate ABC transporter [Vibrio genomosp. F10 str. 9ZD137]
MNQEIIAEIALVEDDDIVRRATCQWLELAGYSVQAFESAQDALSAIEITDFKAIITDVRLPDMSGFELLSTLIENQNQTPVILVTGHGDVDMAVNALQLGAYDFIEKPFHPERLSNTVNEAVEKYQAQCEKTGRASYLNNLTGIEKVLIGRSKVIRELRTQVAKIAAIDTNVIIYGETGCGKELVASCLHNESSRKDHHLVALNCGAIPEHLFESELFGHEAGAFTGAVKRRIGKLEYADKGTLFLDEIESMPLAMQVKVLRSLQDHVIERVGSNTQLNVDLRVIAAAKEDLLGHEQFRPDLFYRLNVAQLYLPPLREREDDALVLFEYFTREANKETRNMSDADAKALLAYSWPGNVRELRNVAIRFALDESMSVGEILSCRPNAQIEQSSVGLPLAIQMETFERQIILDALTRCNGCISDVMKALDLPRRTLNQKMQKYSLNRSDYTA